MKFFTLPALLSAALFSVVAAITIMPFPGPNSGRFSFDVTLTSSTTGVAQVFYDIGRDFREDDSVRVEVSKADQPMHLSFPLPSDSLGGLRFDPIDHQAVLKIERAAILRPDGSVAVAFAPSAFKPSLHIARTSVEGAALRVETTPDAFDPILIVDLGAKRVALTASWTDTLRVTLCRALPLFGLLAAVFFMFGRLGESVRARLGGHACRLWARAQSRPGVTVAFVAALAVTVSSYPMVFFARSLVSPSFGTVLLYEAFPTLPENHTPTVEEVKAADVGAIMWQHVPFSMMQHRALLHDGELPLWNRYNSAGTPLLGQGQSMFGDPLHLGVILAGGASWAWDLKYLAAKWLLGCGLGLVVWRAARHLPAALLVAFSSVFAGFFIYRVNHPAYFSFCYAPWILYAWCCVVDAVSRRGVMLALLGLMLANWTEMNSGTAKEAYMQLFTMNFAGVVVLLLARLGWRERLARLAYALGAGGVFALLSAPVWLTFLDSLAQSYTSYNDARAYQIQPSLLLGLFDEVLLRPFWERENVYNPSGNFLLLLGVLAYLVDLRGIVRNRMALALGLATLVPLSLVFGLVPPQWIVQVPFLGNVAHIDNSFGCGLLHLLAVLAGFGFAAAARRLGGPEGRGDLAVGALLLFALVFPYLAFTQTVQRSTYSYLHWGEHLPRSYFVWGSLGALLAASIGLALAARFLLRRGRVSAGAGLLALTCATVLLWRHGQHLRTQFPDYTLIVPPRETFTAPSPAVQAALADNPAPWRVVGFGGNLFPGWTGVYGLEGINGPDALVNPQLRELQAAFGIERIWDWRLLVYPNTLPAVRAFFDLTNVRYYFDYRSNQQTVGAMLTPVKMADLDVYRSETAWPRAFFTDRVATYADAAEFAQLVKRGDGRPLAAVQRGDRLPGGLPAGDPAGRTVVPATDYRLTSNTTTFTVVAPGPGVVVLTEAWLKKDFEVTVDGRPASYFRVNHAFKGIVLDSAGAHRVSFRYWPHDFTLALWLAAAGGLLLAGAFRLFWRQPVATTPAADPAASS